MKIIFMGTPEIAAFALDKILASGYEVCAVVTQPDKQAGRGKKLTPSPVKKLAESKNIPVFTPQKLKTENFHETLKPLSPDIIIVFAYGKILPTEIINLPPLGCVNIHLSLLPKYRGAAPVQWALINGEQKTGVTIMKIDEGLDTGEIIISEELDILEDDDAFSLSNTLTMIGVDLILKVLNDAKTKKKIQSVPQDNSSASHAPRILKQDTIIDWNEKSIKIRNKIRGLYPKPAAYTHIKDSIFKIYRSEVYMNDSEMALEDDDKPEPGLVYQLAKKHGPIVKTGDGYLIILEGQPENKQIMSGLDLINGGYIKEGMIFK